MLLQSQPLSHISETGGSLSGQYRIAGTLIVGLGTQVLGNVSSIGPHTNERRREKRPLEGETEEVETWFISHYSSIVKGSAVISKTQLAPAEIRTEPGCPDDGGYIETSSIIEPRRAVYHRLRSGDSLDTSPIEVIWCETNQRNASCLAALFQCATDPCIDGQEIARQPLEESSVEPKQPARELLGLPLREMPGVSTGEVAAELALDQSTVSEHLQRAERNLLSTILGTK